jgi:hypothetical protein
LVRESQSWLLFVEVAERLIRTPAETIGSFFAAYVGSLLSKELLIKELRLESLVLQSAGYSEPLWELKVGQLERWLVASSDWLSLRVNRKEFDDDTLRNHQTVIGDTIHRKHDNPSRDWNWTSSGVNHG